MVLHLPYAHLMAVDQLVVVPLQVVYKRLHRHFKLSHLPGAYVRCGDVPSERLDMNIYIQFVVPIAEPLNGLFQLRRSIVRVAQGEVFIDFQMQLDKYLVPTR